MKRFLIILGLVFVVPFTYVAMAQTRVCKPDSMPEADAARIIAIATKHGEEFRRDIDKLRASGVSMQTDTTLTDILADPGKTLARARELYFRRGVGGGWIQYRLDQGNELDDILLDTKYPLQKYNNNYYSKLLDEQLQSLAISIGGRPTEVPYRFVIEPNMFVFALSQFAKSAKLRYVNGGWRHNHLQTQEIQYYFREARPLFRNEGLIQSQVIISANITQNELTLRGISYSGYDYVNNLSFKFFFGKISCLTTFSKTE
ncbi:MAG: hypothetical protein V3V13_08505 [Paracoccaceae bacterium]